MKDVAQKSIPHGLRFTRSTRTRAATLLGVLPATTLPTPPPTAPRLQLPYGAHYRHYSRLPPPYHTPHTAFILHTTTARTPCACCSRSTAPLAPPPPPPPPLAGIPRLGSLLNRALCRPFAWHVVVCRLYMGWWTGQAFAHALGRGNCLRIPSRGLCAPVYASMHAVHPTTFTVLLANLFCRHTDNSAFWAL